MVRAVDGEPFVVSGSLLLPVATRQPIVARGVYGGPGCERTYSRVRRGRRQMAGAAYVRDFSPCDRGCVRGAAGPPRRSRRRPAPPERPCRGAQLARRIRRLQVHGSWRPETERTPKHVRAPIERPFPASAHADSIVGHRREIRGEIEADGLGPNHIRISRSKGSRWRGIWTFLAGSKVERCKAMRTSPRISLIRKWQIKGDNPGPAFPNLTVEADGDP